METFEQQRRSTVGQFGQILKDVNLACDGIDLVDMLWLAQFMGSGSPPASGATVPQGQTVDRSPSAQIPDLDPVTEPEFNLYPNEPTPATSPEPTPTETPEPTPTEASDSIPEQPKGLPFSVPASPALRTRLDLARSLRPLMGKVPSRRCYDLDEAATVTRIAETEVWMPVVRPRPERWLELELVVEDSKTTVIWERAIAELNHLVSYQGAFRHIRTWRLSASGQGQVQLFPRWCGGLVPDIFSSELSSKSTNLTVSNQRPRNPKELIDPTGRRLIWLVSDCTSSLWRQGLIHPTLGQWSHSQPVAIVQLFPDHLWPRTALRDGHRVRLRALAAGLPRGLLPRARLAVEGLPRRLQERLYRDRGEGLVTVPIVSLDPILMNRWARVVAGTGDTHTPGRTFDLTFLQSQPQPQLSRQETQGQAPVQPQPTAQERVALFRSTASKPARQLANLMAAAPVSLPVIDLLREAFTQEFIEEVQQFHVAEVLLSGLLRRCDLEDSQACRYEFWGDDSDNPEERVRDILLGDTSRSRTVQVLDLLSQQITTKLGSPAPTFEALLQELHQTPDGELWRVAQPFAKIGLGVLRRLGGDYSALARRYEASTELTQKTDKDDKNSTVKKRTPKNWTLTCSEEEQAILSQSLLSLEAKASLSDILGKIINQGLFEIGDLLLQEFVDLLIIDSPYNLYKNYNGHLFTGRSSQQYRDYFIDVLQTIKPTLKPNATIYICADWQTSILIAPILDQEFYVRNRITWEREKGRGTKANWKNNKEDIWFCTVSHNYTFNVESLKLKHQVFASYRDQESKPKDWQSETDGNFRLTYPSNIWTDISLPFWSMPENTDHPTQKPEKLMAKLILASSNPGDVVFDPFLGSGTSAVVAQKLNRQFSGVELNQEYCCWALKRLHLAKTDLTIQGFADGVFWERNTLSQQLKQ
jgi:site-specific DNA-methyltransferase (adenine-specific)